MKTNDIKKGTRILLRNGWEAVLIDNKKGTIRDAEVYGDFTECGSIYAHDILARMPTKTENEESLIPVNNFITYNGKLWIRDIELTPAQIKCQEMVNCF